MAKENEESIVKLTPIARREIEGMEAAIKTAERELDRLERMEIDTTQLKKELELAKKRRKILLEEF